MARPVNTGSMDWRAAATGSAVGLALSLPPLVVVRAWKRGDESDLWVIVVLALLVGFAVSGFVAARRRPEMRYAHGAAAAALLVGVYALASALPKLVGGERVPWLALVVLAQIAVSLGVVGGHVGGRVARRQPREAAAP